MGLVAFSCLTIYYKRKSTPWPRKRKILLWTLDGSVILCPNLKLIHRLSTGYPQVIHRLSTSSSRCDILTSAGHKCTYKNGCILFL